MPGRKPGSVRKKEQPVENTAYKYCGKPNEEQQLLLNRTLGACRWLHNRMLSDRKAMYEQCGDQEKRSPAWYKHLMPYGTWLKDTDSSALANEELHLNRAYENFFAGRAGYPKFRKKSDHHDSYTTNMTNGNIRVRFDKGRIFLKLPKIKSEIELYGGRRPYPGGKLKSVTVTHEPNGKYYFSLLYEYPETKPEDHFDVKKAIGLDMSMHEFCVTSEGEFIDHEHPFKKSGNKACQRTAPSFAYEEGFSQL